MANQLKAGPHSNLHTSDVPQDADTAASEDTEVCDGGAAVEGYMIIANQQNKGIIFIGI